MLEALRQGMGRHQRKAFWEATIAVCALVAAPEGKVSFATRVRIDHILDSLPDLKVFDTNEFVELFDRFVEEFRVSPRKARSRALDVARKGANDIDEAELLAKIALAVADIEATAELVDLEAIKALCGELGVDPITVLAAVPATAFGLSGHSIRRRISSKRASRTGSRISRRSVEMAEGVLNQPKPRTSLAPLQSEGSLSRC